MKPVSNTLIIRKDVITGLIAMDVSVDIDIDTFNHLIFTVQHRRGIQSILEAVDSEIQLERYL